MPYSFENPISSDTLPTDVTLRTPVYRKQSVVAALILVALARWSAQRQLARITKRYRRKPVRPVLPRDIPNYLREDLGLPPLPPPLPAWWEFRP